VLPQIWFRNRWSWGKEARREPAIRLGPQARISKAWRLTIPWLTLCQNLAYEYRLGKRYLYGDADGQPLFTNNETNAPRVWGAGAQSRGPFVKDAFHRTSSATNNVLIGAGGNQGVLALCGAQCAGGRFDRNHLRLSNKALSSRSLPWKRSSRNERRRLISLRFDPSAKSQ